MHHALPSVEYLDLLLDEPFDVQDAIQMAAEKSCHILLRRHRCPIFFEAEARTTTEEPTLQVAIEAPISQVVTKAFIIDDIKAAYTASYRVVVDAYHRTNNCAMAHSGSVSVSHSVDNQSHF
ncbi:hypothetical protein RYX36_018374 [Vicia faba]